MQHNKNLFLVDVDSPAWESMWQSLAKLELNAGDVACTCPTSGESWQYIVSSYKTGHEFRHRSHPLKNNEQVIVRIPIERASI